MHPENRVHFLEFVNSQNTLVFYTKTRYYNKNGGT